jgi:hypothetical protein
MTALALAPSLAAAAEPAPRALPEWLTLTGEFRARYETLGEQFRAGGTGGDQILSLRSLVFAEAKLGRGALGLELQDTRSYLTDAGTPLGPTFTNPIDVLQAYVRVPAGKLPGARDSALTLGRFTLNYGSRRTVERTDYANGIIGFQGAYWRTTWPAGHELHAFYSSPVQRLPTDIALLRDNVPSGDESEWGKRFWGAHYRRAKAFQDGWVEAFVYGQFEEDRPGEPSVNRRIVAPGVRLFRDGAPGKVEWDVELTQRFGKRRATLSPTDTRDLDVSSTSLNAAFGYMLDRPSRLRLRLELDYASGDDDPRDGRWSLEERNFGNRRTDLGVTGIFGPFAVGNIIAPGARAEGRFGRGDDWRLLYKAGFLAERTDAWGPARLRDPTGRSGRFIGHMIEARTRIWLRPDKIRAEFGAATLIKGDFARNAPGAPRTGDTLYGWAQVTSSF